MTSPSWAEAPAGIPQRSARPSWEHRSVCVELEPELGGTCLRVGCIPTKAWVQTAHALHQADEVFAKFGVNVSKPELDFGQAVEWKNGVVKQMTGGIAGLFKANGVEWVKGRGRFTGPNTIAVEGGEDITFKSAIVATGSYPAHAADRRARLASLRRLDRPARADRGAPTARDPRRRHHRVRVRLDLPAVRLGGHDRRDARDADPAGGRRRGQGAREGSSASAGSRSSWASSAQAFRTTAHSSPCTSAKARACRPI